MTGEAATTRAKRSLESRRFEQAVLAAALPRALPPLVEIDLGRLKELVPWIAIVEPNHEERTLKFVRAGAGVSQLLGRDAVGFDYLEIVDPAIKGDAFDSAFLMLTRPCGLWQLTPSLTSEGQEVMLEYTGFPVYDEARARGQLLIYVKPDLAQRAPQPRTTLTKHSTEWSWIEMKSVLAPR